MRPALLMLVLLLGAPGLWAAPPEPPPADAFSQTEFSTFVMVTDDPGSNRAFYQAIGFDWVPEERVNDASVLHGEAYCQRLARNHHLDPAQARFLGMVIVQQYAVAPACYTREPFTDEMARKRCGLMKRTVLRNDPATRTLVCGAVTATNRERS